MGAADDIIAQDAIAIILSGEFVETLTYKPYGGAPVQISAIVIRHPPSRIGEVTQGLAPFKFEIYVAIDGVIGRSSVNIGGDKISVADRKGGTPVDRVLASIEDSAGGFWKLGVE